MLQATRSALAVDADLLAQSERETIDAALQLLTTLRSGDDAHAIDAGVEALATATESFAAARMNRGIRKALAGRRVSEV
jgi:molecular chaperone HscA